MTNDAHSGALRYASSERSPHFCRQRCTGIGGRSDRLPKKRSETSIGAETIIELPFHGMAEVCAPVEKGARVGVDRLVSKQSDGTIERHQEIVPALRRKNAFGYLFAQNAHEITNSCDRRR